VDVPDDRRYVVVSVAAFDRDRLSAPEQYDINEDPNQYVYIKIYDISSGSFIGRADGDADKKAGDMDGLIEISISTVKVEKPKAT
jgi:hypothetical protein